MLVNVEHKFRDGFALRLIDQGNITKRQRHLHFVDVEFPPTLNDDGELPVNRTAADVTSKEPVQLQPSSVGDVDIDEHSRRWIL